MLVYIIVFIMFERSLSSPVRLEITARCVRGSPIAAALIDDLQDTGSQLRKT